MRIPILTLGAAAALLLLPAVAAGADAPHGRLIETKADAIVSVKYVLQVQLQTGSREWSGTATGVIVDPVGLIVVPSYNLAPRSRGSQFTSTPTSLRVIFPGDPKEYDAILGATDSRLGLAFVRIKDLGGKKLHAIDASVTAEPVVGDVVYGVSRLSQGFDYAAYCDESRIVGHVSKPRKMWLLQGRFTEVAHPIFNAEGALLGWLIGEQGVDESRTLPFLLPLKVAQSTIKRGAAETQRVLEETLEREAEEGDPTPTAPASGTGEEPPEEGDAGDEDMGGEPDEE